MWLYPLPAIVSGALWLYVFFTGPKAGIAFSFAFMAAAIVAYFLFIRHRIPAGVEVER
jgi:hypothetical protein